MKVLLLLFHGTSSVTVLWAGQPTNHVSIPIRGKEFFFSPTCPYQHWGVFSRIKYQGCEADLLPPPNAKVKNGWSYTTTPQYALMAFFVHFDISVLQYLLTCCFGPSPYWLHSLLPPPHYLSFVHSCIFVLSPCV